MENFVTKGITIARDRIYRPIHEGGLGLIPLEQYIQGLHCSWFKRAYTMAKTIGNLTSIRRIEEI
jgi:hypothetical protein